MADELDWVKVKKVRWVRGQGVIIELDRPDPKLPKLIKNQIVRLVDVSISSPESKVTEERKAGKAALDWIEKTLEFSHSGRQFQIILYEATSNHPNVQRAEFLLPADLAPAGYKERYFKDLPIALTAEEKTTADIPPWTLTEELVRSGLAIRSGHSDQGGHKRMSPRRRFVGPGQSLLIRKAQEEGEVLAKYGPPEEAPATPAQWANFRAWGAWRKKWGVPVDPTDARVLEGLRGPEVEPFRPSDFEMPVRREPGSPLRPFMDATEAPGPSDVEIPQMPLEPRTPGRPFMFPPEEPPREPSEFWASYEPTSAARMIATQAGSAYGLRKAGLARGLTHPPLTPAEKAELDILLRDYPVFPGETPHEPGKAAAGPIELTALIRAGRITLKGYPRPWTPLTGEEHEAIARERRARQARAEELAAKRREALPEAPFLEAIVAGLKAGRRPPHLPMTGPQKPRGDEREPGPKGAPPTPPKGYPMGLSPIKVEFIKVPEPRKLPPLIFEAGVHGPVGTGGVVGPAGPGDNGGGRRGVAPPAHESPKEKAERAMRAVEEARKKRIEQEIAKRPMSGELEPGFEIIPPGKGEPLFHERETEAALKEVGYAGLREREEEMERQERARKDAEFAEAYRKKVEAQVQAQVEAGRAERRKQVGMEEKGWEGKDTELLKERRARRREEEKK